MNASLRRSLAVLFLIAVSAALNGCAVNADSNKKPVVESACANTVKDFDSGTAAQILLTSLPAGVYTHASAEVYVMNSVRSSTSTNPDVNEVQFLETPNPGATPPFSTGILCRETSGAFHPYFEQPPVIVGFTHYANGDFLPVTNSYPIVYQTDLSPSIPSVSTSTGLRSNPSTIVNLITNYWNAGYHFIQTATNTYVFYGVRIDSATGRTVRSKASYVRSDLPSGTI